jgi:MoxR-like ATPase
MSTTTTAQTGVAQRLRTIIAELSAEYRERDTTLTNGVLALLARQHHMVVGPIGAAKSAAHEAIVERISGANFFATQMHDAMKADELFGQIDMPLYDKEGRWVRRTEGYLPSAHLAMIDEIDKGQHLLRSLLRVANERRWRNGDAEMDLPLITMVASANEALGEDLSPVWDRFLIRETVSYIEEPANFIAMLAEEGRAADPTTITVDELQGASLFGVPAVTVEPSIFEVMYSLRSDLRDEGVVASDRRWKDSVRLLQARAFLAGRAQVNTSDLIALRHVLWTTPEQESTVTTKLLPLVNADAQKLADIIAALVETTKQLDALAAQSRSAKMGAAADLAEKLSRFRAELRVAAEDDEGLDADYGRAARAWVRAKARMNEVCGQMPADRARKVAQDAWDTGGAR